MKNYFLRFKKNNGKSFYYTNANGKPVNNKATLEEIQKIYIAPAYKDVKIYLGQDLLATGVDEAGRTQYVYSSRFKMKRENKKFQQLVKISERITKLNHQISKDLDLPKYTMDKMCAIVLRIMNICNFRGGNKKNEKLYKHHGVTTLHKKHVEFRRGEVIIDFIGKKGVQNVCSIKNPEIIGLLKDLYRRSSKTDPYLFSVKGEDGEDVTVTLQDVNKYLEPYDITSKDLRTWNANIIFLRNLHTVSKIYVKFHRAMKEKGKFTEKKDLTLRKKILRSAIEKTARALHNTPAICKASYLLKSMLADFETYGHYFVDMSKMSFTNGEGNNANRQYEEYFTDVLRKHGNYQKNRKNTSKYSDPKNPRSHSRSR